MMAALPPRAPAFHTRPKSRWNPSAVGATIADAAKNAQQLTAPMVVIHDGEPCGLVARRGFLPLTRGQWAGFPSYDALNRAYQGGQRARVDWWKNVTGFSRANVWGDAWVCAGSPAAGGYTGTANTARQFDNTTAGGMYHSGILEGAGQSRHVTGWKVGVSNGINWSIILYDRVLSYDGCSITNSATTLTNTLAPARYVSSGQDGLMVAVTASGATGATASNLSSLTVTDQQGNTNVAITPGGTLAWYPSCPAAGASIPAPVVLPFDTGDTVSWTPFLPLAANVAGVRQVTAFTSSAANSGTISIVLLHPMASMWVNAGNTGSGVYTAVELGRAIYALEKIFDTACLSMLVSQADGASSSDLIGHVDLVYN